MNQIISTYVMFFYIKRVPTNSNFEHGKPPSFQNPQPMLLGKGICGIIPSLWEGTSQSLSHVANGGWQVPAKADD